MDHSIEQKIKASLEHSLNALDNDTCHALAASRKLALSQPKPSKWRNIGFLMPASALAFCLMLGVFFVVNPSDLNPSNLNRANTPQQLAAKAPSEQGADQVAMLELLTNTEELEAMSDPAFLMWAVDQSSQNTETHVNKNAV